LMLEQAPTNWRVQIERVQRNAMLLLNRVNDILDFSKAEADKFEVRWEAVNLCELIPMLVGDAMPMAESRSCKLECHVDSALSAVCLDRGHFEKILLNFLSNALKFTPPGGWILVDARPIDPERDNSADMFEFSVKDSGLGIAEDKISQLFNRFHQIDNSATRVHSGTGIGLALAKELTELLGGTVGVESQPGQGSRFFVHLPRGTDRLTATDIEKSQRPLTSSESMLRHLRFNEGQNESQQAVEPITEVKNATLPVVLVADDNSDMRAYITELLKTECNILTAVNGQEAWGMLQRHRVDVVLSDVMMPELDGLGLTARIKNAPDFSHLPVILVTARGGTDASVSGLETGADDYIAKPFSPVELRARVKAAIRMAHIQTQLREKSREAGMAIVATGILHNLGNILNGVTISSGLIQEKLHHSKIPKLQKVAQLLHEHQSDLPSFISDDSRGQVLPAFITQLSEHLEVELKGLIKEVEALRACTEHVAGVITTQQKFAMPNSGMQEMVSGNELMERALILSRGAFEMRGVDVICDFTCGTSVSVDCNKVLQILLNLIANARHAVQAMPGMHKCVWLRTRFAGDRIQLEVQDNGVGISAQHLPLMFNQGFTTKKEGHGVGLHSSANWAREMGGTLTCHSDGLGFGATFVLALLLEARNKTADRVESLASS
jgi:two-component system sensor histidine kinase ChiS